MVANYERFRKSYAHEVRMKWVGVWDTVGALGISARPISRRHNARTFQTVDPSVYDGRPASPVGPEASRHPTDRPRVLRLHLIPLSADSACTAQLNGVYASYHVLQLRAGALGVPEAPPPS